MCREAFHPGFGVCPDPVTQDAFYDHPSELNGREVKDVNVLNVCGDICSCWREHSGVLCVCAGHIGGTGVQG
jgi:hypothetical protein